MLIIYGSMIAGSSMAVLGVIYLIFEDFVLSDFGRTKGPSLSQPAKGIGRMLAGVQVGSIKCSRVKAAAD